MTIVTKMFDHLQSPLKFNTFILVTYMIPIYNILKLCNVCTYSCARRERSYARMRWIRPLTCSVYYLNTYALIVIHTIEPINSNGLFMDVLAQSSVRLDRIRLCSTSVRLSLSDQPCLVIVAFFRKERY